MLKQRPTSNPPPSFGKKINITQIVTVLLILPWPSLRFQQLKILEIIPPLSKPCQLEILKISPIKRLWPSAISHTSYTQTFHSPKIAKPSIEKLERRKRRDIAMSKLEKALFLSQPLMSILPIPIVRSTKR